MDISERLNRNMQIDLNSFDEHPREVIETMITKSAVDGRCIKRSIITGIKDRAGYNGRLRAIHEFEGYGVLESFGKGKSKTYTLHLEKLRKIL